MTPGERRKSDWGARSGHLRVKEGERGLGGLHGDLHERGECGFIRRVCVDCCEKGGGGRRVGLKGAEFDEQGGWCDDLGWKRNRSGGREQRSGWICRADRDGAAGDDQHMRRTERKGRRIVKARCWST